MLVNELYGIQSQPIFYHLQDFANLNKLYVKMEGLNIAGSIKLKSAYYMIAALENEGRLVANESTIICSSSGNLAVAAAILCKEKHYNCICVTDNNIIAENERLVKLYGAKVIKVNEKDANGGYLGKRLEYIQKLLSENDSYFWLNQYENKNNMLAHFKTTAKEIDNDFPNVDYIYVGAGTTGTLMGILQHYKNTDTKVIAVDAYGSVTFGMQSAKRLIPGIGTSKKPPLSDLITVDSVRLIKEIDTINMCHYLSSNYGLCLGGSSGSVLAAVYQDSAQFAKDDVVVAISPDMGSKYMSTIYNDSWLEEHFGKKMDCL